MTKKINERTFEVAKSALAEIANYLVATEDMYGVWEDRAEAKSAYYKLKNFIALVEKCNTEEPEQLDFKLSGKTPYNKEDR